MSDADDQWDQIVTILHSALPEIDSALSQANVPISARSSKAFEIVRETMLETSNWQAFLVSEAHGRILIIISEWYRERYGDPKKMDNGDHFVSAVIVHGTPFILRVPRNFKTLPDAEGHIWIGFPASVQSEEAPVEWIENQAVLKSMGKDERERLLQSVSGTADLVRSAAFDLRALEYDRDNDIAELAGSIGSDLQASARHLCEQSQSGLRSSGWNISQATEKALKLLIRRKGHTPPFTHNLAKLARQVENLKTTQIDRGLLGQIPSDSDATSLRYGGDLDLESAIDAYQAGLRICRQLLFEATPDVRYNVRNARFKIRTPPWFSFDTKAFAKSLRARRESPDA